MRKRNFEFTAGRHHFTPIYEQSKYKYLVYVDGHCAACRYGFMMRLGSVILKVASRQVADTMWYFPLLKPYFDHIPVKADLSDLEDRIKWCRENDAKCKEIGLRAKEFYEKYVGKEGLLDYVEMVCKQVSKRQVLPPNWYTTPTPPRDPPTLRKPNEKCHVDRKSRTSRFCVRCQRSFLNEEKRMHENRHRRAEENREKRMGKNKWRERMQKKARY